MQVGELEEHADVHFLAGCAGAPLLVVQWLAVAGSAGVLRLSPFQSSVSSSLTMIT